jgi:hypothetical protein
MFLIGEAFSQFVISMRKAASLKIPNETVRWRPVEPQMTLKFTHTPSDTTQPRQPVWFLVIGYCGEA